MTIRPIRTEHDYETALKQARRLITLTDQQSIDDLEILQALIERWEQSHDQLTETSPADAIKFRMSQKGLKPRDLEPYIGSKSRVSEILNGQRQPTVDQIRALHTHLGIPVGSLIGEIKHEPTTGRSTASVAAIEKLRKLGVMKGRETIEAFLFRACAISPAVAMLRKTRTERTNAKTDFGALEAWCAAVMLKAESSGVTKKPIQDATATARGLAKLSTSPHWHTELHSYLGNIGIVLVILEHLPGTYLDGAAMRRADGTPIIALTLRHDRIDNFWFTLLHEYAHVVCHLGGDNPLILDDLEVRSSDAMETEADEFARDALIPPELWSTVGSDDFDGDELEAFAEKVGVHPAIVAGRWQHDNSDYRKFARLVGRGQVRKHLLADGG
ncbi:ImmA/IrrE family metallo-endopeptidase [Rhizobium mesosinicum]|uniref:ImmA/IrrE family metallo-endopeptidase n=1 Tax=Rhizobium mesosinicum TaxID=335017 RepID=A0ABS7GMD7_9HYPH|nr:ImmA/IrrE family metallo-endopeptidase [Rhizobium mesosinicum]MBW9051134.1 ImmA/IrrE family metallo-endopeptidase [Rhizobium mesosinicum]